MKDEGEGIAKTILKNGKVGGFFSSRWPFNKIVIGPGSDSKTRETEQSIRHFFVNSIYAITL